MSTDPTTHWQTVYQSKATDQVSWFSPHLDASLSLLRYAGLNPASRVIDIGAGASTLVDDLLDTGVHQVTALDISAAALEVSRQRLGIRASQVNWIVGNITQVTLPGDGYDLWHDRAALHFLTEPGDITAYINLARQSIAPDGHAIIGGFASDGPEQCSRLNVTRREPQEIATLFGSNFTLIHQQHEHHVTPWGTPQSFAYAVLRKTGS